jgi:hypothetical protein
LTTEGFRKYVKFSAFEAEAAAVITHYNELAKRQAVTLAVTQTSTPAATSPSTSPAATISSTVESATNANVQNVPIVTFSEPINIDKHAVATLFNAIHNSPGFVADFDQVWPLLQWSRKDNALRCLTDGTFEGLYNRGEQKKFSFGKTGLKQG